MLYLTLLHYDTKFSIIYDISFWLSLLLCLYGSDFFLELSPWILLWLFFVFHYQFGWLAHLSRLSCDKWHQDLFYDRDNFDRKINSLAISRCWHNYIFLFCLIYFYNIWVPLIITVLFQIYSLPFIRILHLYMMHVWTLRVV